AAARRAARSSGLQPLWGLLPMRSLARGDRTTGSRVPRSRSFAVVAQAGANAALLLGAGAIATVAAHGLEAGSASVVGPSALTTAAVWASAGEDAIEDTVVTDAVGVSTADGSLTILALGHGKRCSCSLLFRSTDAGRTWRSTPAPDVSAADPIIAVSP